MGAADRPAGRRRRPARRRGRRVRPRARLGAQRHRRALTRRAVAASRAALSCCAVQPAEIPVVILCGGRGTRLRAQAADIPKPLVEIGGRPILWHVVQLYAAAGFRR
ncbi:MAG TPA: NTP transferase domain-containing protein, partial [Solirubrobacteraceae bacterium]|nr:NTP transferase domain-containing protein [Solirubrobacteraceae bacterium]